MACRLLLLAILATLVTAAAQDKPETNKGHDAASESNDVSILSDTGGIDLGPYLKDFTRKVRENWLKYIPEEARLPTKKKGTSVIEFAIQKDGTFRGMKLASPSGSIALDRAAWAAITSSDPADPLPKEFKGEYLTLRLRFLYNPDQK